MKFPLPSFEPALAISAHARTTAVGGPRVELVGMFVAGSVGAPTPDHPPEAAAWPFKPQASSVGVVCDDGGGTKDEAVGWRQRQREANVGHG